MRCKNGHNRKEPGKICAKCHRISVQKFDRTPKGRALHCLRHIRQRNRKEGITVDFESSTWCAWTLQDSQYEVLYKKWKDSGFKKALGPSPDRKNPLLGYVAGNVRWTTWEDNHRKGVTEDKALHRQERAYGSTGDSADEVRF